MPTKESILGILCIIFLIPFFIMSKPQIKKIVVIVNTVIVYAIGFCIFISRKLLFTISPIEINISIIAKIPKAMITFNEFAFLSFLLFSPKLLNPASATNLFKSSIEILSSYSIDAVAITKLTVASFIPFCLFKYFSKPFEQALQVIPSIFKIVFIFSSFFYHINLQL